MASFSIPLTGLEADSTALNTIANDLSNMNTTAFKAQTTNFSDLFYQQIGETGSGDPIQVGAGVKVASNSTDFSQGSYNTSGTTTSDMAIDGNGFFILDDGGRNIYTRNGAFSQDTNGNLVTTSGLSVMGYPAPGGVVNTNAPLAAISIPLTGQVQQPTASTTFNMTANLDSEANSPFPATVPVFDSLGAQHNVTVAFTQTSPDSWTYSAALPASDYSVAGGNVVPAALTGTLTFNQNGDLVQVQPTGQALPSTVGTAAGDVQSIAFNFNPAANNVLADGAAGLNLQWNLLGSAGLPTISQTDEASALSGVNSNGNAAGTCTGFTIGSDGTVTAQYTSGTEVVGQVALANMTNLQGLQLLGDGNYATTLASGTATVGVTGSGGLGTIQDSALEASNVNISSEFSDLIVAQRAFEANAKSVTTFDQVTEDTINMVH
ncbi:MAG TPA: flagellar hook protein FlgE [Terracidiphilus sp.]|jgi:flagellar hook protein FlgE